MSAGQLFEQAGRDEHPCLSAADFMVRDALRTRHLYLVVQPSEPGAIGVAPALAEPTEGVTT